MEEKHAATPWRISTGSDRWIVQDKGGPIACVEASKEFDNAAFIVRACNAHDELVAELKAAERIIKAMLATMSAEQKIAAMDNLGADHLTRHHERCAALALAGAA